MRFRSAGRSLLAVLALAACNTAEPERSATATPPPATVQGWSEQDRNWWYGTSQGSRLLPQEWLAALEQPASESTQIAMFMDAAHIASFRYLPRPSGLPVGFALSRMDDDNLDRTRLRWKPGQGNSEPWVGMTCSACHTAEVTYNGRSTRIEGGPTLADFQGFMQVLQASLAKTLNEPDRFERFAGRMLQPGDDRGQLRSSLGELVSWIGAQSRMNGDPPKYGYGRLDAVGHILNRVALLAAGADARPHLSSAPVSYPFLWNIHQLPAVQYNAFAPNDNTGALGRNVGEVIGVFADVKIHNFGTSGYVSSVDTHNITALEQMLHRLEPPGWPTHFPRDESLFDEGKRLFDRRCASCHTQLSRNDLTSPLEPRMSFFNNATPRDTHDLPDNERPGTDPWMACNSIQHTSPTGSLAPRPLLGVLGSDKLGPEAHILDMLKSTVGSVIGNNPRILFDRELTPNPTTPAQRGPWDGRTSRARSFPANGPVVETAAQLAARLAQCEAMRHPNAGYKARPLTGIWATAPYLHNGSVANLYQLLLPPAARLTSFAIGTREFDPVNVGYSLLPEAPGNSQTFTVNDPQGRPIPGNSNAGHDYGNASLSDDDRRALIEYMKTL